MAGPFQTPQNEKSFSGLIDQVLLDTGRLGALLTAIQYCNATIRECHALGLFYQDLIEDQVTATTDPYIFTRPFRFRKLRTAQYNNCKIYPKFMLPGRQISFENYEQHHGQYYYAADDYFSFKGVQVGEAINYAAYFWPRSFEYGYRLGATNTASYSGSGYVARPAYFDKDVDAWKYLNVTSDGYVTTTGDPAVDLLRQQKTMDWILKDWYELVQEGTKNKIFNLFGDARATGSFSLYKSMQKDLVSSVQFESEGM